MIENIKEIEFREANEKRQCNKCGEEKLLGEFYRRGQGKKEYLWLWQCKKCHNARTEKWRIENPEQFAKGQEARRVDGRRRRYRLKALLKTFGLSLEWYDKQMKIQKWRCASCNVHLDELNPSGKALGNTWATQPCIHHSHSHGDVYDILCSPCNLSEGLLKTPERAYALWKYMSRDALFYSALDNVSNSYSLGHGKKETKETNA